jgi:hypothetical protein
MVGFGQSDSTARWASTTTGATSGSLKSRRVGRALNFTRAVARPAFFTVAAASSNALQYAAARLAHGDEKRDRPVVAAEGSSAVGDNPAAVVFPDW